MRITDYICSNDFVGDTFVNWACLFVSERMGNGPLAQTKSKDKRLFVVFCGDVDFISEYTILEPQKHRVLVGYKKN